MVDDILVATMARNQNDGSMSLKGLIVKGVSLLRCEQFCGDSESRRRLSCVWYRASSMAMSEDGHRSTNG